MAKTAGPTAALAGVPAGLQSQGVWVGRRQLFVRFAAEAETATMYTAEALANELKRGSGRSVFHSICISGRDPLANVEYLCAAFSHFSTNLPVMIDCDGQRPDVLAEMRSFLSMVQVTLDGAVLDTQGGRAMESLKVSADAGLRHALVLSIDERTTDGVVLRAVEQAHAVSAATVVVLHPGSTTPVDRDRRWMMLMERAAAAHGDVRFSLRLPPPTGMR